MGVFSSWDTLEMNSDRWLSTFSSEAAMELKASARVLISSQRSSYPVTRTSNSPRPNFRAASAISFRGLD